MRLNRLLKQSLRILKKFFQINHRFQFLHLQRKKTAIAMSQKDLEKNENKCAFLVDKERTTNEVTTNTKKNKRGLRQAFALAQDEFAGNTL